MEITKVSEQSFSIKEGYDPVWLDQALEVYNRTELQRGNKSQVHEAFSQSQVVSSIWANSKLIGVGRAISDFKMYSSIFDVVVDPEYQNKGVGKALMTSLLEPLRGTCVYLTSTFGNEHFYKKLGFRFHKSAMALYPEKMQRTSYLFKDYQLPTSLSVFKGFSVRLATISDCDGCFLLNEQLGYKTDAQGFLNRFKTLVGHPEHSLIVVFNKSGEVVAWMHMGLRYLLEDENFAQLAGIVVRNTERSFGIGSHLLLVVESWARHHGMNEIALHSSFPREEAHKFYLKNGYTHLKSSKLFTKKIEAEL